MPGDNSNDQARVMTPKDAFNNKVSGVVMGRSLTKGNIRNNAKATKYAKQILKKKPVQAKSNDLNIDTDLFPDQINSIRQSLNNYSRQKQLENEITNTRPKPRTSTGLNYLMGVADED